MARHVENKEYENYAIGVDEDGKDIFFISDPSMLSNYFEEYRRVLKKRLKEEGNEIIKALRFHCSLKIVLYRNDMHRLL
ncbi:MAG: hypothetical protein ACFNVX_09930 [Lachnoanaerobaculum saburreum]